MIMRKFITTILFVIGISAKAQSDNVVSKINILQERIENRQVQIDNKYNKDSLYKQVADYKDLTELLNKRVDSAEKKLNDIQLLISSDTIVFYTNFNPSGLPLCLKPHIALIERISHLRVSIEQVEHKINSLSVNLHGLDNEEAKQLIRKAIEKDIETLNKDITEIKEMDLSSLSTKQYEFFKPGLTERYNNFSIYFE